MYNKIFDSNIIKERFPLKSVPTTEVYYYCVIGNSVQINPMGSEFKRTDKKLEYFFGLYL